jgi:hypothetical protein
MICDNMSEMLAVMKTCTELDELVLSSLSVNDPVCTESVVQAG